MLPFLRLQVRARRILRDSSVLDVHDAVGKFEDAIIVRDHHDGASALVCELAQDFHHRAARCGIERGRRLIGQHDSRIAGERTGDRDTLFLSAAQVGRQGVEFVREAHLR